MPAVTHSIKTGNIFVDLAQSASHSVSVSHKDTEPQKIFRVDFVSFPHLSVQVVGQTTFIKPLYNGRFAVFLPPHEGTYIKAG